MLDPLRTAHAWLINRTGGTDRGDNPVPTAIIIAGLAAFAIVVLAAVTGVGQKFLDQLRNLNP